MYVSDFFYIWKTNRMTLFYNLFMERPSYKQGFIITRVFSRDSANWLMAATSRHTIFY